MKTLILPAIFIAILAPALAQSLRESSENTMLEQQTRIQGEKARRQIEDLQHAIEDSQSAQPLREPATPEEQRLLEERMRLDNALKEERLKEQIRRRENNEKATHQIGDGPKNKIRGNEYSPGIIIYRKAAENIR